MKLTLKEISIISKRMLKDFIKVDNTHEWHDRITV